MMRSDWIALAACIASFVGLIPPFLKLMKEWKPRKRAKQNKQQSDQPVSTDKKDTDVQKWGPYMKAFVLTCMAVLLFLIELILFTWIAYLFGVNIEIGKMPLVWTIGFFALFIIPGLELFLALVNIVSTFED